MKHVSWRIKAGLCLTFLLTLIVAPPTHAVSWLQGWGTRLSTQVTSHNSTVLSNHQVPIPLPSNFDFAGTKPHGEDVRVTDTDGVTELSFWLQNYNPTAKTGTVWVKLPQLSANSVRTIYIYTKNSTAYSKSNGQATFPFFSDFTNNPAWYQVRSMPADSADLTAAQVNGKYYLIGGYNYSASDPLNMNFSYDPYTDRYEQKASMPTKRWGPIAAPANGKIYIFGGETVGQVGTAANEMYDPAINQWTRRNNTPTEIAKQGLTGCSDGTNIYLQYGQYFYRYNPSTDFYTRLPDLPLFITSWATCATHQGKVYIVNGHLGGSGVPYLQIYDTARATWSRGADSPFGVYGAIRENPVIGDDIYLIQGQRASGEFSSAAYKYNIPTNTWAMLSYGPHAADGVAGGVYGNGLIYTFGGRQDTASPYGLRFATGYYPSNDRQATWQQRRGNFEATPNGLRRMTPVRGSLASPYVSQIVSDYRPSPPYIVEMSMNQTANTAWNSLAVQTNGLSYNQDLMGYHAVYNDTGIYPARTNSYFEQGTQFRFLGSAPIAYGRQQFRTYVVPDGIVTLRNGQEILRHLSPIGGNGSLSLQTAIGNTAAIEQVFVRSYAQYEVTATTTTMQLP